MPATDDLIRDAEECWLSGFEAGPTEPQSRLLGRGDAAPDAELADATGTKRQLAESWATGPALVLFWRHFGCRCGMERARRLESELGDYRAAGLAVVIVGQGQPAQAAQYADEHGITVPVLVDPTADVYRAYGVGHWQPEQLLFDAPAEYLAHPRELGRSLAESRRAEGRPMVDDPWRAAAEFIVAQSGVIRLGYSYQYCEDFPDPRVLTTAARLAERA
jgi:peroxiredoxin